MSAGTAKPLLEVEARERQLAGLNRGSKSPLPTTVGNGDLRRGEANELAGATVGVSGKARGLVHVAELLARDPAVIEARRRRERRGRR